MVLNLTRAVFFNLFWFAEPFRLLKKFGGKFGGTPNWLKLTNTYYVLKHQKNGCNSKFGGTPDTSLQHPSVQWHPGWESQD